MEQNTLTVDFFEGYFLTMDSGIKNVWYHIIVGIIINTQRVTEEY